MFAYHAASCLGSTVTAQPEAEVARETRGETTGISIAPFHSPTYRADRPRGFFSDGMTEEISRSARAKCRTARRSPSTSAFPVQGRKAGMSRQSDNSSRDAT